jgi:5-formyltetrahydrofolate cyclo-ligase
LKIAERAASLPEVAAAGLVALYVSRGDEVDTAPLIRKLLETKGVFAAPRVIGEGQLEFHLAREFPQGFSPGRYGILEPDPAIRSETIDIAECGVVFVPGVAFDRKGNRIGYGKGYYDRALQRSMSSLSIGLAYSFQVLERVPSEAHDVPIKMLITEDLIAAT